MSKIAIIGGGAAGMMAAIVLARQKNNITLFEKNDRLGRKLFITGKGRCNLTNNCDTEQLLNNVVSNSKFMYSAFDKFNSQDTISFFEGLGLKIKTERGGRVFPLSDHSSDVIGVLSKELNKLNVKVYLNSPVISLISEGYLKDDNSSKCKYEKKITGLVYKSNTEEIEEEFDKIVVATGGVSYPLTGSTGDGIKFAKDLDIKTVDTRPALVPLEIKESFCKDIMGLALKNVQVSMFAKVKNKEKLIYKEFGEMLFTHYGISGPIILSGSSYIGKYINDGVKVVIDMKPALSYEQLDDRILKDFQKNINKQFRNSLDELLPKSLIPIVIDITRIDPYKKVNEVKKEERQLLVKTLKEFTLNATSLRDYNEAIITQGGVSVKEVNPSTMECKWVKNLMFVGEVLDVDALTGGYNLQIAWSTASLLS